MLDLQLLIAAAEPGTWVIFCKAPERLTANGRCPAGHKRVESTSIISHGDGGVLMHGCNVGVDDARVIY